MNRPNSKTANSWNKVAQGSQNYGFYNPGRPCWS